MGITSSNYTLFRELKQGVGIIITAYLYGVNYYVNFWGFSLAA